MADYERRLSSGSSDEETLDPRIQVELEKLNKASEEINRLELELDDARAAFRQDLSDSTQKLNAMAKKLGACIEKARPYYDARMKAKDAHIETQRAAVRYERACSMHEAAKEMVHLAEQGYMKRDQPSDPAWQEMLNHATMKVNEAEKERIESEQEHEKTTKVFKETEEKVQQLQKELKRAIAKSKPYFEMKVKFNQLMDEQKQTVSLLETDVVNAKATYAEALRNLESISDEIHEKRLEKQKNLQLGVRSAGVGSETPSPPPAHDSGSGSGDGSVVAHISTCSNSANSVALPITSREQSIDQTALASNVKGKAICKEVNADDSAFVPLSLIYHSPEQARRLSYRKAIETSQNISPTVTSESISSTDFDEDFDAPSLEEECMTLPSLFSSRGRAASMEKSSKAQALPGMNRSDVPSVNSVSVKDEHLKTELADGEKSKPLEKRHEQRPISEVFVSSPSGTRKTKLQGIILRVDPSLDPYLHGYFSRRVFSVDSRNSIQEQLPVTEDYQSTNCAETLPVSQKNSSLASKPTLNFQKLARGTDGIQGLKVPSPPAETMEDNSDTESLASTGPMLDDDQVEFLCLDFSDQISVNSADVQKNLIHKTDWKHPNLPPQLSHLEQYMLLNRSSERTMQENGSSKPVEATVVKDEMIS